MSDERTYKMLLSDIAGGGSGGSGGGYDLVVLGTTEDGEHSWTASDISVVSGSLAACEQKVLNNEPVNGLVMLAYHTGDYDWARYGRVISFDVSYKSMRIDFGSLLGGTSLWYLAYDSNYEITAFDSE